MKWNRWRSDVDSIPVFSSTLWNVIFASDDSSTWNHQSRFWIESRNRRKLPPRFVPLFDPFPFRTIQLRLGAVASSDIDVLVTHPTASKLPTILHQIVKKLKDDLHFVTDTISIGDSKFMVRRTIEQHNERFRFSRHVGRLSIGGIEIASSHRHSVRERDRDKIASTPRFLPFWQCFFEWSILLCVTLFYRQRPVESSDENCCHRERLQIERIFDPKGRIDRCARQTIARWIRKRYFRLSSNGIQGTSAAKCVN